MNDITAHRNPSSMWAPWNVTAPPTLSDDEIEKIISDLLGAAMKWDVTDDTKLAQLWYQFNISLLNGSSSEKELLSNIDGIFTAFVKFSQERFKDLVERWTPEEARKFIFLVNTFLNLLKVKKVYNNIPRQDFTDFSSNRDHTQVLQLTLPRWENIWERTINHWGSCHNWSIIFKQYLDTLGIRSSIIFCNPFSNHSFTLLELSWKYYIIDPLLKVWDDMVFEVTWDICSNDVDDKWRRNTIFIWQTASWKITNIEDWWDNELNIEMAYSRPGRRWELYDDRKSLRPYSSVSDFCNDLDSREIEYIILWYRLADGNWFELDFNREGWSIMSLEITYWEESLWSVKQIARINLDLEKFITKFIEQLFWKTKIRSKVAQIIKHYSLKVSWAENSHEELLWSLLNITERNALEEWIWDSSNFDIFSKAFEWVESFYRQFTWKKNERLREEFERSTHLMHKRSVVNFLLLDAFVDDPMRIEHRKDTYARKPKILNDDWVNRKVAELV